MSGAALQQGMKQNMVATAAMQQFMRTLQATTAELQQLAAQAMAANPALEELPPPEEESGGDAAPLDRDATRRHELFLDSLTEEPTLREHVAEQLRRSGLETPVEQAALQLVDHLSAQGRFDDSPEELCRREQLDPADFLRALSALRDCDPPGVGAFDLRDSLMLQLERAGESEGLPMQLLREHWEALVRHRYADAARALGCTEGEVAAAAQRIARLDPDPGSRFARTERDVIRPDLLVDAQLHVTLTGEQVPRLTLSPAYRELMAERAEDAPLRRYLSRCFREGREFIRAVEERQRTLLLVARAIVARQQDFFRRGPARLAPLKMEQIAADTGLSISTVSRAVNGKYLGCAFGVWELRRFFSQALPAAEGNESALSAETVQARIRALIAAEDPRHPLSDAKIEKALAAEGLRIARRTIAKYREQMKILPTSLRRRS
ncbi:MAG: RNA polymerase factor sigma-54 [Akkermansia sp.]